MATRDEITLGKINDAIDAILDGQAQSVNAAGRGYVALGLDRLQEMKREYEDRVSRSTGGMFSVSRFQSAD